MSAKDKLVELHDAECGKLKSLESELCFAIERRQAYREAIAAVADIPDAASTATKLQDKVQKEAVLIDRINGQISSCKARVSAYEDAVKIVCRNSDTDLRPDSVMNQVRQLIRKSGRPMTLSEILSALNLEGKRGSLRGSLVGYAKESRVFTKEPEPDTFGLLCQKSVTLFNYSICTLSNSAETISVRA